VKIQAAVSRAGHPHPQIEELELEEPRFDEVRVRIVATGICHTDLNCHCGRGMPIPCPSCSDTKVPVSWKRVAP
jgi:aryl-alcohol dehydrogenase